MGRNKVREDGNGGIEERRRGFGGFSCPDVEEPEKERERRWRKGDVMRGEEGEEELGLRICNIEGVLGVSECENRKVILGFKGLALEAISEVRPGSDYDLGRCRW